MRTFSKYLLPAAFILSTSAVIGMDKKELDLMEQSGRPSLSSVNSGFNFKDPKELEKETADAAEQERQANAVALAKLARQEAVPNLKELEDIAGGGLAALDSALELMPQLADGLTDDEMAEIRRVAAKAE